MSSYLVTFELNYPGQQYDFVRSVIDGFEHRQLTESSFVILTDHSPSVLYDLFYDGLDDNDSLFIIHVDNPADNLWYGFGDQEVHEWLEENLDR